MDMVWFVFCLLAAVGVVQLAGWLVCLWTKPYGRGQGYYLVPLSTEPEVLEAEIRHHLLRRSWGSAPDVMILMPEAKLTQEGEWICQRLIGSVPGVFLCYSWELENTLKAFVRAQENARAQEQD